MIIRIFILWLDLAVAHINMTKTEMSNCIGSVAHHALSRGVLLCGLHEKQHNHLYYAFTTDLFAVFGGNKLG